MLAPTPARGDDLSVLTPLVDAAAQRLQTAEPVAAFKWATQRAIEDPGRVQQELASVGAEATGQRIDPGYVTRVFRDQINATEAIEYSRFAQWKLNPDAVPTDSPDLSVSRSEINAWNHTMLTQLVTNWEVLHAPVCAAQLAIAKAGVVAARRLDSLYQQGIALATQSYCQQ